MTEQLANAQPEAQVSGGQTASETPASASPVAQQTPSQTSSLDAELERIWESAQETTKPRETQEVTQQVSDQPTKVEPEPGQSSPAIAAPHSWSAEYQGKWTSLPPELQKYISERESQAHTRITQAGNELKAYAPLREVYSGLHQMGVPQGREAEVITNWARAQAFLDQNPTEGLRWLAKSYNVDPAQLVGQGAQQTQTSGVDDLFRDPRLDSQVLPEVNQLKAEIARLQGHLTARERAELEERQTTAEETIAKFAEGKTDWADLVADVTKEVAILRQENPRASMQELLDQAYDRAKWANPVTRQRTLEAERKVAEEKAQKEREKAAAEAKKHAAMNVRTGAAASTPAFDGKWNDDAKLSALYDQISAR
jgi:hypothetical protein